MRSKYIKRATRQASAQQAVLDIPSPARRHADTVQTSWDQVAYFPRLTFFFFEKLTFFNDFQQRREDFGRSRNDITGFKIIFILR